MLYLLQSSLLPRTSVQGAVEAAIAAGYRHIDTAYSYGNEVEIGKALRSKMQQGIIRREDMFIVSKVSVTVQQVLEQGPGATWERGITSYFYNRYI